LSVDGAPLLLAAGLEAPTRDQRRPGVHVCGGDGGSGTKQEECRISGPGAPCNRFIGCSRPRNPTFFLLCTGTSVNLRPSDNWYTCRSRPGTDIPSINLWKGLQNGYNYSFALPYFCNCFPLSRVSESSNRRLIYLNFLRSIQNYAIYNAIFDNRFSSFSRTQDSHLHIKVMICQ
jgi:hypothetical protein